MLTSNLKYCNLLGDGTALSNNALVPSKDGRTVGRRATR